MPETKNKELSFEEAYSKLEECSKGVAAEGMTLEETVSAFEEGTFYYRLCSEMLDSAEQRIIKIDEAAKEAAGEGIYVQG